MFYFYLLECWRHWSRQRLIPLRPVCSRDKRRGKERRGGDVILCLTGFLMPTTKCALNKRCIQVKCARCILSFWLLDILSSGWFICFRFSCSFFHHLLIVFDAHFVGVLCCVRCNLFNLIHNLFVLL